MLAPQNAPIPEVFVLWHPRCVAGQEVAQRILRWLRPGNGLGPEVFYRSAPAPEAAEGGLPPPLPGERRGAPEATSRVRQKVSNLQVVLALIDENMVSDQAWRYWLADLSSSPWAGEQRIVLLPIALDPTASNMPPPLRDLNYLRPVGAPLPSNATITEPEFEKFVRSLLKQVTEAMCGLVLPRPAAAPAESRATPARDPLPKVHIFLSHAKKDGTVPARRLRDYIYSQTQLAAFFDENDISYGTVFGGVIDEALRSSNTAALVAVRSASYASRPWCRREFASFRQPRRIGNTPGGAERWFLFPALVVEAMEGKEPSRGIPEFGNSTLIRWADDGENLEELIVTTVIRDAMLASVHSAIGASIQSSVSQIVINWIPDPTTLLLIPSTRFAQEREVLYPGRGLSLLELDVLGEFFPNLTFRCFEEIQL